MSAARGAADTPPTFANAAAVTHALAKMFPEREYAFFPELRNGTGYARRQTRTADAVAMGLWPSRGLVLHGFEIKVSRRDWLAELRVPEKADEIAAYCDLWSLVVGDTSIVEPGELPPKWGLIVPEDRPRRIGTMRVIREPERLDAKPLDRLLVASILRSARRGLVPSATVTEAAAERVSVAHQERDQARADADRYRDKAYAHDALKTSIENFERASGIRITPYDGPKIGAAVRVVLESGIDARDLIARLSSVERIAAEVARQARSQLDALAADRATSTPARQPIAESP